MKSPVYALWDALAEAGKSLADGLTLAAETLCPRDHTAEDRLRAWESAAEAVEGEICDEADACEAADEGYSVEELFELRNRRYADSLQSSWRFVPDSSAADEPSLKLRVCSWCWGPYTECGGKHLGMSPVLRAAYRPDSSAAVSAAADGAADHKAASPTPSGVEGPGPDSVIPQTVGPGRSTDPGEVSPPSPGEQVREDDLAAHILASAGYRRYDLTRAADAAARSLLTDFNITRK